MTAPTHVEIQANGTSFFINAAVVAGQRFNTNEAGIRNKLVQLSDFVIDQDNRLVKCRYDMREVIRGYCNFGA